MQLRQRLWSSGGSGGHCQGSDDGMHHGDGTCDGDGLPYDLVCGAGLRSWGERAHPSHRCLSRFEPLLPSKVDQ